MVDETGKRNPYEREGPLMRMDLSGIFENTYGGPVNFRGNIALHTNTGQFVGVVSDLGDADIAGELVGNRLSFWKLYRRDLINSHAIRYELFETAEGQWEGKYTYPEGMIDVEGEVVCQTIPSSQSSVSLEEFLQRYSQVSRAALENSQSFEARRRSIRETRGEQY